MSEDPIVQQFEGAVDVNGKVTPITRQPVTTVAANKWATMSRSHLFTQREALNGRLSYAQQMGNPDMIKAIQMGIAQIDVYLNNKATDELGLL